MAELKPNFALDLSNDGIALWHRSSGAGWASLANIELDDPDLEEKLKSMRHQALDQGQPLRAIVRIPRSEVLLSRVKLGVFEGEAAKTHALKQIEALTPYSIDEIAYDLGEKTVGSMAPVGVVSRTTLKEAEAFAQQQGFSPVYYTTQYTTKEFPREPRFRLDAPKASRLPLVSKIAAAAAVGLTLGYFGFSALIGPDTSGDSLTASAAVDTTTNAAASEETALAVEKRVNPDGEPNFSASQVATFVAPPTTQAAAFSGQPIEPLSIPPIERLDRLAALDHTTPPFAEVTSDIVKTDALALSEARRDLPEVAINDEVVNIIQSSMNLSAPSGIPAEVPIVLASLTPPDTAYDQMIESELGDLEQAYAPPSSDVRRPADAPPEPEPVIADPGTLTPTPEGTRGPENIMIYSGRPPLEARARPVIEPPADPLAEFRPRSRPEGLLSDEQLAALAEQEALETAEAVAAAEPETAADAEPESVAEAEPETADSTPEDVAAVEVVAPEEDAAIQVDPEATTETALAEPDLNPDALTEPELVEGDEAGLIGPTLAETEGPPLPETTAAVDPEAIAEPESPLDATQETAAEAVTESEPTNEDVAAGNPDDALLAEADPALVGKKSRARPTNLKVPVTPDPNELLARADPALAGVRAKTRPANLKIPAEAPDTPSENTLDTATALAVAASPMPKKRPAKIASIASNVKLPSDNAARDAATAPSDVTVALAKGTAKPSKSPTSTTVAKAATEKSKFNKSKMNLVGVFGRPNDRRALVRLSTGRYVKVKKGDRLSGWKVSAIGESSVRINKGTKDQVLRMP